MGQRGSFRDTTPWGRQTPPIRSDSQVVTPESVSPKRIVRNGTDEDEEKGRKLACEFLDEDFTNVSSEKVAMFLGAPSVFSELPQSRSPLKGSQSVCEQSRTEVLHAVLRYEGTKPGGGLPVSSAEDLLNDGLPYLRDLCAKLYLKAESQEIDRILEGFSTRYYECNPTTVFGTPGE